MEAILASCAAREIVQKAQVEVMAAKEGMQGSDPNEVAKNYKQVFLGSISLGKVKGSLFLFVPKDLRTDIVLLRLILYQLKAEIKEFNILKYGYKILLF